MFLRCYRCREPIWGSLGYCPLCDTLLTPLDSLRPWRALRARWAKRTRRKRGLLARRAGYTVITLAFLAVVVTGSIMTRPGTTSRDRAALPVTLYMAAPEAGSSPDRHGMAQGLLSLSPEAGQPPSRARLPAAAEPAP